MRYRAPRVVRTPLCVWGDALAQSTGEFLSSSEPCDIGYLAPVHSEEASGEEGQYVGIAPRLSYLHGLGTLFSLIGAARPWFRAIGALRGQGSTRGAGRWSVRTKALACMIALQFVVGCDGLSTFFHVGPPVAERRLQPGWRRYRDAQARFSFAYPESWQRREFPGDGEGVAFGSPDGAALFALGIKRKSLSQTPWQDLRQQTKYWHDDLGSDVHLLGHGRGKVDKCRAWTSVLEIEMSPSSSVKASVGTIDAGTTGYSWMTMRLAGGWDGSAVRGPGTGRGPMREILRSLAVCKGDPGSGRWPAKVALLLLMVMLAAGVAIGVLLWAWWKLRGLGKLVREEMRTMETRASA